MRFAHGLLACRYYPIVVCLVDEKDYAEETKRSLDRVDTECPLPFLSRDDEGCEQRSEVW